MTEIVELVAETNYGAGGAEGAEAAYRYPIGEYPLHPIKFKARYLALYVYPLIMFNEYV
jgi:hypothetical protein